MLRFCPAIRFDLVAFCVCGAVGQVLVFKLIKEYGSLVWITISVTRQLFTIVLSVLLFGHSVNLIQWGGVMLVFCGLSFEVLFNYLEKHHPEEPWDGSASSLLRLVSKVYDSFTDAKSAQSGKGSGHISLQKPALSRTDSDSSVLSDIEQHRTPELASGRKKHNNKQKTPIPFGGKEWDKRKHD